MNRPALAALIVLPVALALTVAACDNSSLVGDGSMGNPIGGGGGGGTTVMPDAVVTASAASGAIPFDVTFSGASSTHPNHLALTYTWYFSDGTGATGVSVQKRFTEVGAYRARLTVRDAAGATDTASVVVQALAPTITCPALGTPTAGTFYATTCDSQGTLFAPAAFYIGTSGVGAADRIVQFYLLDTAQRIQFKFFGTFAPGTTITPGTYRLLAPTTTRNYTDFTSSGDFAGRLDAPPTGTLTVESVTTDRITGRIDATVATGLGYGQPLVVRFSANRSASALG